MKTEVWKWVLGLIYIFAVASIWIAASFVVQSVVDAGVSPFLITYICNSLFVIYIPLVEIGRYLEDNFEGFWIWRSRKSSPLQRLGESEQITLLEETDGVVIADAEEGEVNLGVEPKVVSYELVGISATQDNVTETVDKQVDGKGRWTRTRVAKSNTILSSSSSLFTFLVSLVFLGEKFTLVKLISVLLCMGGTIIVSLGDSRTALSAIASNPLLGDILALVSAALYSVYITLIRKKLPDEDDEKSGRASMAQFLGFLGLSNLLIFLPVALILHFSKLEPFYMLTWEQVGLIVGKGLLDNVLSDYLWAKAVLLTTTTVATAGLTIQVPLAAIVDSMTGHAPHFADYLGAGAVMIGFAGINIPSDAFNRPKGAVLVLENENLSETSEGRNASGTGRPWVLGLIYIFAVASIWIAASFVVRSVVDAIVSPFLIKYICNSLFVIYVRISFIKLWSMIADAEEGEVNLGVEPKVVSYELVGISATQDNVTETVDKQVDGKGRWTRTRVAKVSLLISPFWFFAQLTFNLSLKYTTVTSNTILSSSSSLFTFSVSLAFLGEKFTLVLISVLLCMGGTIIVSLGDSRTALSAIASNPLLGDILALVSAALYSVCITLIRTELPDEDDEKSGRASMAQFLRFLGLSNLLIFLPVALVPHFLKLEPFYMLTWEQVGLIVGKGVFLTCTLYSV
ncbi:hypothetical protein DVH24_010409 [Malus domestica]|uniref:EamA domain-containing protein n=1 Tax=Malus domestica TaxID=3750 RepID=A0A498JWD7_MALDO|nr:hypothetical protein DVH24_010409 [Malus domestica]